MFTGIVEEVGRVESLEPLHQTAGVGRLSIRATKVLEGVKTGDSLAANGACFTVVAIDDGCVSVELSPETLRRTNLGSLGRGSAVNLERALAVAGRFGGHIVQGHVDGTGKVISSTPDGDCVLLGFRAPKKLMPYIVEKGFVAVDGVSLTVVKRGASYFSVSVIPYTLDNSTLKERRIGDRVNLEVDILAKYVESLLKPQERGPALAFPGREKCL